MIELGLSRISQLLKNTTIKWKAIHIAGTNGKGSTAAYLSNLLHRQGLSVGRFTSPHLIDRWDCITLNECPVEKSFFNRVENEVKARNETLQINATEFELLTATAFEIFNKKGTDVGVIECGLGGRLDATNVLEPSDVLVSVITKIGLDHQALLGDTFAAIAKEKAGIMKKGVPVVIDSTSCHEATESFRKHAEEVGSPLTETSLNSPLLDEISYAILPTHQEANLELALKIMEILSTRDPRIQPPTRSNLDLPSYIRHVQHGWPGRLQWLSISTLTGRKEEVLLDGAHNPQSAQVLADYVYRTIRTSTSQPITWVIGMSKGKDILKIVRPTVKPGDRVVATRFGPVDGMPWVESEDPERITEAVLSLEQERSGSKVESAESVDKAWSALRKASRLAGDEGPLVIAGSLYLVSDVLRMLRSPPTSLDPNDVHAWNKRQISTLENRRKGIFE